MLHPLNYGKLQGPVHDVDHVCKPLVSHNVVLVVGKLMVLNAPDPPLEYVLKRLVMVD